jgi:hypothetical protein
MHRITGYIVVFFIFYSCHSPIPPPKKNSALAEISKEEPFNRHSELVITRHALCRMDCRHITLQELHEILDSGTINYKKSEPEARPDPKYALEGFTRERQHLRIIMAPDGNKLILITCIELGVEWTCHCN